MPGPGQRVKYPRGRGIAWHLKQNRGSKGKNKRPSNLMDNSGPKQIAGVMSIAGGKTNQSGGGYGPKPPWGGKTGGEVDKGFLAAGNANSRRNRQEGSK